MSVKAEMREDALVSVIMPSYNAAAYIEQAIRSVMAQTYPNWELLVLDDGSGDDSVALARRLAEQDPRITVLENEQNVGVAATRNKGLDLCAGTYVAFLDSDDGWHPEKLACQMRAMQQEQADLVYTSYRIVDEKGTPCKGDYLVPAQVDFDRLLRENVIGCSTVLLSRQAVRKYRFISGFYHEDYCLWLEMLRDGCKAVGCTEPLTDWRLVNGSRSFDKKNAALNRWRIYRRHLGLSFGKSVCSFCGYACKGVLKYGKKQ